MRAEPTIKPEPKEVFKVAQWKWNIDEGSPWWRRFFFKRIFLPFLSFSFQLGVPTPKEVIVEADENGRVRKTFRWWEDEGIFEHPEQADAGCLEEHWGYTNLPYGRLMPPGSGQYGVTIFPRKQKDAKKWAKPKFPFLIKDRKRDEQEHNELAACLKELNKNLDRALDHR